MPFQPISGSGGGGAFVSGDKWGFRRAEKLRNSLNALAALKFEKVLVLGGDRGTRYTGTAATAFLHPNYWPVLIDWTQLGSGLTVVARVEVITDDAACSILARVRNITDSVNYDYAGSASVSTSYVEQTITIPAPGVLGLKRYHFYLIPGATGTGVNGLGTVEAYA